MKLAYQVLTAAMSVQSNGTCDLHIVDDIDESRLFNLLSQFRHDKAVREKFAPDLPKPSAKQAIRILGMQEGRDFSPFQLTLHTPAFFKPKRSRRKQSHSAEQPVRHAVNLGSGPQLEVSGEVGGNQMAGMDSETAFRNKLRRSGANMQNAVVDAGCVDC